MRNPRQRWRTLAWSGLVCATLATQALAGGDAPPAPTAASLEARAAAATPDPAHGRILYLKHCVSCHGAHAWGDGPREIPTLAGQWESYLRAALARFATGERAGLPEHGAAMHETLQPPDVDRPQALADLSAWLATAPRNPDPEHAAGSAHGGGAAYARLCAPCHGADGAGNAREPVPAIGGQHYSYLLGELEAIAAGTRRHPRPAGGGKLGDGDRAPVAAYAARLTWLTARDAGR